MKKGVLFVVLFVLTGCYTPQPPQDCTPGATQSCVCSDGRAGSQTCNPSGTGWEGCSCIGGTTNPPPDSGTTQPPPNCLPTNAINLDCGCWGYAVMGQVVGAPRCCSGRAVNEGCDPNYYGYCAGGTIPWGNRCE